MVKKNILIANAYGELIYLNNQMYKILKLESDDVLMKNMEDTLIPESIKEAYDLALKRRSKIENAEIHIIEKKKVEQTDPETGEKKTVEVEEDVYVGFANVIPIRAKESSLDYYMMVLSTEMFV